MLGIKPARNYKHRWSRRTAIIGYTAVLFPIALVVFLLINLCWAFRDTADELWNAFSVMREVWKK